LAFRHLTSDDVRIVGESLRAAVSGPFFPDWEFPTLFGLERAEVEEIAKAWPNVEVADEHVVDVAVNNALGNLVGYPHGEEQRWPEFISVPPEKLLEVLERWKLG
jgi:hypothetical protein